MDKKYLIDTNILIYYLDNKIPVNQINLIESILKDSFNISTITKIELLGWNKLTKDIKKKIEQFLSNSEVFYINSIIEQKAIDIKQKNKIHIADAIIAATSLVNNMILVTRNSKDFETIAELRILNPFE